MRARFNPQTDFVIVEADRTTRPIAPGDPLVSVLPADASQALVEEMRKAYGFDRPLPVQFAIWLGRALAGDLSGDNGRNAASTGALAAKEELKDNRTPLVVDFKVFPDSAANGIAKGTNGFQVAMLGGPSNFILGAPGGGKSACARDIVRELGITNVVEFTASLRDPVDVREGVNA